MNEGCGDYSLNHNTTRLLVKKIYARKEKMVREKVTKIMIDIGIPASLKGYHYIIDAILMVIANQETILQLGKSIYTDIAKEYNTNVEAVERDIRTAIEKVTKTGNIDKIYEIFGNTINPDKGKPTNKEFIATIAYKIKLEMNM